MSEIEGLQPDLGVLADYGQIIPRSLLELPARGILNVHPSLLPRHRGATPIPAAIAAGDAEGGVAIIRMDDAQEHASAFRVLFRRVPEEALDVPAAVRMGATRTQS